MKKWDITLIIVSSIGIFFSLIGLILSCMMEDYRLVILNSLLMLFNTIILIANIVDFNNDSV